MNRKIVLFQVFTTSRFDKNIHVNKGMQRFCKCLVMAL